MWNVNTCTRLTLLFVEGLTHQKVATWFYEALQNLPRYIPN